MQANDDDDDSSPSIISSFSFVIKSTDASEASSLDEPTSEPASTPLSPEVEPTSMMLSWRSFDDAALTDEDGDGESFSSELVDSGDDVMELNAFVMNIFGVERPVSLLLLVDESGLGQMGKGDMIGDDPRLKLIKSKDQQKPLTSRSRDSPFSENSFVRLRRRRRAGAGVAVVDHLEFPLDRTERARADRDWRHGASGCERSSGWRRRHAVL